MSDGARCHYCRKSPCECLDPAPNPTTNFYVSRGGLKFGDYASPEEWLRWFRDNAPVHPDVLPALKRQFEKEMKKLCPEK